jgi:uncharacterized SAM-binding protein YcdF (DUF218 family)
MNDTVIFAANVLWRYLRIGTVPGPAECLLVLGSRDDRVASYAASLANKFSYDHIVVSGGEAHHNDLLTTSWDEPTEAEHFLSVMRAGGLTQPVLMEKSATNTGDNAIFSHILLKQQGIQVKDMLIVTKPYMERRALAAFEAQWPGNATILVCSEPTTLARYCNHEQPIDTVINIMVGDLQRIIEYPALGFQTEQVVPAEVRDAMRVLIEAGFIRHLIK